MFVMVLLMSAVDAGGGGVGGGISLMGMAAIAARGSGGVFL